MSDYIYTRDNFDGYEVEDLINTRATLGSKAYMTAAEVMCDDLDEYEGFDGFGSYYEDLDTVRIGESKGYKVYDAPVTKSGSDIIANLIEYAVELDKEITFERTSVMNTVFSDVAGCRIEATEFTKDGRTVKAVDYIIVYWKGKAYKVNKAVAYGTDAEGECIMGYEIDEADLMA
jgi:hypothetical protein